jgi:hypothetical protein
MALLMFGKSIPIVLLVFAAFACWLGLRVRNDANAERNWPTAPGVVSSVAVIEVACGSGTAHGILRTCPEYRTTYTYDINGIILTGSASGDRAVGAALRVAYDPRNPTRSVLNPGGDRSGIFLIGAGIFLALLAPIAWVRRFRRRWDESFDERSDED